MAAPTHTRSYLVGLIGAGIGGSLSPALHEHEASCLGLAYAYRVLDIDELGVAAARRRRAARAGPRGRLRRPQRHAPVQAARARAPRRADRRGGRARRGQHRRAARRAGRGRQHRRDRVRRELPPRAAGREARPRAADRRRRGGRGGRARAARARLRAPRRARHRPRARRAAGRRARRTLRGRAAPRVADGAATRSRASTASSTRRRRAWSATAGRPSRSTLLRPELWVADVVYRPLETELLRDARAAGCRTLDGGGMVVLQAAGSFERFTGTTARPRPDAPPLRDAGR